VNEGWASYWHETLFLKDERIKGHEVDFSRVNAVVTAMPRVGLNPYALGMRLFYYIEEMADKGKFGYEFQSLLDADQRKRYDVGTGQGKEFIFKVRENFCDFMFVHTFLDQDFITRNNLFVAGKRLNKNRMVWEYYVKSRNAKEFRQMIEDSLYHPPHIDVDPEKSINHNLYLFHHFEGKPLVKEFIANTMMGIEYLWDGPVQLETSEVVSVSPPPPQNASAVRSSLKQETREEQKIKWQRVVYTMKDRKLSRKNI
jgi:stage V sporulation protein R